MNSEKSQDTINFKSNFFTAFWFSCTNFLFYTAARKASWLWVCSHILVVIFFTSFVFSFASYGPWLHNSKALLKDIPTITIKDGKANWDESLELPYIKSFPEEGPRKLYLILDNGDNRIKLEETYPSYFLFLPEQLIVYGDQFGSFVLNSEKKRETFSYKEIESSPVYLNYFGNPPQFSSKTLPPFLASLATISTGTIFFFLLLLTTIFTNIFYSFIASTIDKWGLSFTEIFKTSVFASTPAYIVLSVSSLLISFGPVLLLFIILLSGVIHFAYLVTGLKCIKETSS